MSAERTVTALLQAWARGERNALDQLLPVVYDELRRLAGRYLNHERQGHTWETRELIHEAFLRLVGTHEADFANRAQFFGLAARVMRNLLVDHARKRAFGKHGGRLTAIHLDDIPDLALHQPESFLELHEALEELARAHPALAEIVELRCFGGLKQEETAAALGISTPTVKRRWRLARAWLFDRLAPQGTAQKIFSEPG